MINRRPSIFWKAFHLIIYEYKTNIKNHVKNMKLKIENKLNLPTNKMYFEFFGSDGESCGIAFYESKEQAMQDCLELIKDDVDLAPYVKLVNTIEAIEIINERANKNFEFPMDSGDSFFKCN